MRIYCCVPFLLLVFGCGATVNDNIADAVPKHSPVQFFVNFYNYGPGDGGYTNYYLHENPEQLTGPLGAMVSVDGWKTDSQYRFLYTNDDGDHYSFQVTITDEDHADVISESKEFVYDGTAQELYRDDRQRVGVRPLSEEELASNRRSLERQRKQMLTRHSQLANAAT